MVSEQIKYAKIIEATGANDAGRSQTTAPRGHGEQRLKLITPTPHVNSITLLIDSLAVTLFGTILCTFAVFLLCIVLHPNLAASEALKFAEFIMGVGITASITYFVYYMVPVWPGLTLLAVQLLSGTTVGQYIVDSVCVWMGIAPASLGVGAFIANAIFTVLFCLLPAFSRPLYEALLVSSPLQNTLATSVLDTIVTDKQGRRLGFQHAFKRSLQDCFGVILFHWSGFRGGKFHTYPEWLSNASRTLRIKRPRKLSRELLISKNKILVRYQAFLQVEKALSLDGKKYQARTLSKGDLSMSRAKHLLQVMATITGAVLSIAVIRSMNVWLIAGLFDEMPDLSTGLMPLLLNFGSALISLIDSRLGAILGVLLFTVCPLFVLFLIFRPTDIEFSKKGLRFIGRHMSFMLQDPVLPWTKVKRIGLELPKGKTSVADHWIVFYAEDGTRRRLRVGNLDTIAAREEILNAIERWAPTIPRDVEVIRALQAPCDYSYTEIWLEALSAPPERERLEPLIEGALLKNNHYRVLSMLGSGGQGTAYSSEDCLTGDMVVLKEFMLPVFVDVNIRRNALSTFEQEARLLKELEHPQVVKLIDYFIEDHRAYLVLEHIDGLPLDQLVKERGPVSEENVIKLAIQMCDILGYLSSRSTPIVHRDFTPDNLILNKDGTLKLIDFNVAHQENSEGTTGTVVGKTSYMAPEQFRGAPCIQSDLYSMGASLFYLLTAIEPTPISSADPVGAGAEVSGELNELVRKLTQPDLSNRIASVARARQLLCSIEKKASDAE